MILTPRVLKKNVGIFTEIFLYKEGLKENCISQYSANLLIFLHSKTFRKLFYHLIFPKSHTTSQLLQFLFLPKLLFLSLDSFSLSGCFLYFLATISLRKSFQIRFLFLFTCIYIFKGRSSQMKDRLFNRVSGRGRRKKDKLY